MHGELQLTKRVNSNLSTVRGRGVARDNDPKAAHVRVVRRERHARVGRKSAKHDHLRSEIFQQQLERSMKETRMLRLQDEVVLRAW